MSVDPDFVEPELMAVLATFIPNAPNCKTRRTLRRYYLALQRSAGYTTGADIIIDGAYTAV